MPEAKTSQLELVKFSRVIALLFNRAAMYQMSHPYVRQTIDEFNAAIEPLLKTVSPLVFIMNRDQLFIDEEPLDPRINVNKIISHFKKTGIQSISFEDGLGRNEIRAFLEVYTSLDKYPDAGAMKKALTARNIGHVKINHVFFKKVTEDEEVIAQDALKKLSPDIMDEAQLRSRKMLVDVVLESVLTEESLKSITVDSLMKDPGALSDKMAKVDREYAEKSGTEGGQPGAVLLQQLEVLNQEVEKRLKGDKDANLPEMAAALFEMKKRLVGGIEARKALDIELPDEELVLDKVNEITDNVVLKIIKAEYGAGETPAVRLAQIIRRLIPEPEELRRLLPKIKTALMEEGMTLAEYRILLDEFRKELQSEQLAGVIREGSEEIGIDGESLIREIKANPVQAAELIFLAAEIRKGTGDERVLADLLVDYVERLGSSFTLDTAGENETRDEKHLRRVMTTIESGVLGQLRNMEIRDDILERLEKRFNERLDEVVDRLKVDVAGSARSATGDRWDLSVLQLLEQSAGESRELADILETVRSKSQSGEIDENDFGQIYDEILKQQEIRTQEVQKRMPVGLLKGPLLTFFVEKEIARARRYGVPFAALGLSVVRAVLKSSACSRKVSHETLMAAVYQKVSAAMRRSDMMGELGKNRIIIFLPMTSANSARTALGRYLKLLHGKPVNVGGVLFTIRIAGVVISYDSAVTPDARAFVHVLTSDLTNMEMRIRNIQAFL